MRCKDVERLGSEYIDGELHGERAERLRGHLRQCARCRQSMAQLAAMVDAASQLEPLEPPARLWSAIQRELADGAGQEPAEPARHWLSWLSRPRLLPMAALGAALVVLGVWAAGSLFGDADRSATVEKADRVPSDPNGLGGGSGDGPGDGAGQMAPAPAADDTFAKRTLNEVEEADRMYLSTIEELRQIVDEERPQWPEEVNTAYEKRMQRFEDAARRHRQALAGELRSSPAVASAAMAVDPRGRDALYAVYQAEIDFLQAAAVDGPPPLQARAGTEGAL